MYVIVKGLPIDVGIIIEKEIRECAMKKHKTTILLFASLITSICVVSRVHLDAQDDRVKNNGALTARTIERITGESAAAPPEPVAVTGVRRVAGMEGRI